MKTRSPFAIGLALVFALWAQVALALPRVEDVQAAANKGDYPAAEQMMREVIDAKPGSAKAHYVLAEILAHQRKFREATEQVRLARLNDPAIKFADPAKFTEFERKLEQAQSQAARGSVANTAPAGAVREPAASGGGVPLWLLLGGVAVFIVLAARWMRNRAGAPVQPMPAYAGGGYGQPMGYGPAPAPAGSGMLGVGLAAAGGVAAGMLAEKLLHEGHEDHGARYRDGGSSAGSFDDGYSSSAADDLVSRNIDYGSGGGWDSGSGGGDFGGGGDGGGGDW